MNENPQNHWIRNNLIAIFLVSFAPAFYLTTTSSINAPAYWLIVTILALVPLVFLWNVPMAYCFIT